MNNQHRRAQATTAIATLVMFTLLFVGTAYAEHPRSAYERSLRDGLPQGPSPPVTEQFDGTVIRVIDGDTIVVRHDGRPENIRLQGIDAPEMHQRFGPEAARFVQRLALRYDVHVQAYERDRDGRLVADVFREDGKYLNAMIVEAGWAWRNDEYAVDPLLILEQREDDARHFKLGLWVDEDPVPPWEFRKYGRHKAVPFQ